MVKDKKKKKELKEAQKAQGNPVAPPTTTPTKPTLKKLFVYDNLNVHSYQKEFWKETKSGIPFTLEDYELLAYEDGVQYLEKMFGETVAGKVYELTEEQLKDTDWYENENNERVPVTQNNETIYLYRRVKK